MFSSARLPIRLGLIALAAAVPALFATSSQAASSSKACSSANIPSLDGGYIYHLKVKGVSCATGRQVQVGFQKCRLVHGKSGRCESKVLGFACKEGKRDSIPTNFLSSVTCTKGKASLTYGFEQDTL